MPEQSIQRPVIILSLPRTGSTMLFDTLALSPSVFTVGGESHSIIEKFRPLTAAEHGFESSGLGAEDATPEVCAALRQALYGKLRDREGRVAAGAVRMLEKTPRNALRVPFLDVVFPDARFIVLYRDPVATIRSMLAAWRSRWFISHYGLPGWWGPFWSLLLIPGWRELQGKPLPEIVTTQWMTATRILFEDVARLPPERWCATTYERLVRSPREEILRLCAFAEIEWDREIDGPLPRAGVGIPRSDGAEDELAEFADRIAEVDERARAVIKSRLAG